jgi:hypothetical protein
MDNTLLLDRENISGVKELCGKAIANGQKIAGFVVLLVVESSCLGALITNVIEKKLCFFLTSSFGKVKIFL